MKKKYFVLSLSFLFTFLAMGKENVKWVKEKIVQVKTGNFSLPVSQQPGPLIAFGQNIVDKGEWLVLTRVDQLKAHKKSFIEVAPSVIYGINDTISLFIELPIATKFQLNNNVARGIGDLLVQCEGVVYAKETAIMANVITLVGNIGLPTSSAHTEPLIGLGGGSTTVFFGFTASHTGQDWYYFVSSGANLTTSRKGTKFGNQFLYEGGISKNICYKVDSWIFNGMIEFDGIYKQRDKINRVIDGNSGGNQLFFYPSLWFSTQRFLGQFGVSWIII
ncbi:MAG TPA: hypothetical protein VLB80_00090, partial [Candidatus Babeliales bacterium]|nr:hypothetical protein [Candidatus Babeliales bacterium]